MMSSSCCRLSLTTGSAGNADTRRRIASSAGTLAAGSSALNPAIACLGQASDLGATRHAAPRRVHSVEEIPRGGLAPEQAESVSILGPPATARGPTPNPCVLCMARLRAAIEANDSPDTGSSPPTRASARRPRCLRPTPAPAPPRPTLWKMRLGCHGVSSPSCSGNACGVAGELEGFDGEDDGCGVMAVCGARLRREPRHDHVRTERADHADDVGEDGLPVPDPQRLPVVLRDTRSPSRA